MADKVIVVPGELVTTEKKKLGNNVFLRAGKIYSSALGIVRISDSSAQVVPLTGKYMPRKEDIIIGIIKNENFSGFIVDINSFYNSFLAKRTLNVRELKEGDIVQATVSNVNEVNEVELVNVRVLFSGELITVSPVKVPRIIGKQGSMLKLLKDKTGSFIIVGQNGRVWLKNGNTKLCIKAIRKIEKESHLSNLTQIIGEFLDAELNKKGEFK